MLSARLDTPLDQGTELASFAGDHHQAREYVRTRGLQCGLSCGHWPKALLSLEPHTALG